MIGVWAMCLWEQMGQPNRVNLVELGPGRGTLMMDLLRVCKLNSDLNSYLELRMERPCAPYFFIFFNGVLRNRSKFILKRYRFFLQGASKFKNFTESLHLHLVECSPTLQKLQHQNLKCVDEDHMADNVGKRTISTLAGTPVSWHSALEQVPSGCKELSSC